MPSMPMPDIPVTFVNWAITDTRESKPSSHFHMLGEQSRLHMHQQMTAKEVREWKRPQKPKSTVSTKCRRNIFHNAVQQRPHTLVH